MWSFCRRRTDPVEDGWVLPNIAITTFLSNQAHALTPPFWTTCESPLLCMVCVDAYICVYMDCVMDAYIIMCACECVDCVVCVCGCIHMCACVSVDAYVCECMWMHTCVHV